VPVQLPTPLRGLLAGVFVLIAFAWCAVAMTAGGSSGGPANPARALTAQTAVRDAATPIGEGLDEEHGRGEAGHHR
jgi:hypothetical protein